MIEIPWRTGVNMREFAYYGTPARQHTTPALQRTQLEHLREMQVHLVRFYASCNIFAAQQCSERVLAALNLLDEFGMQAILCVTDSLGSEFTVQGNEPFHCAPLGHLIKDYWHQRAYEAAFMEFLRQLLDTCAQHPAVFMWELGNEYAIHPQPASWDDGEAFLAFAQRTSQAIKEAAPDALVSTGLVGTHHVAPHGQYDVYATMLYGLDTIDAISIHYYADDGERDCALREVSLAKGLGKPYYIGEFGAPRDWPDRGTYYRAQLEEWQRRGAFTALPWAFDASPSDVGVSDTKAFARIHPDFDAIVITLREFARPPEPVIVRSDEIPPETPRKPPRLERIFRVVDGPVNVRRGPSLFADLVPGVQLTQGQEVKVDGRTRTVADGFIWWHHQDGWSAERSVDREAVFLKEKRVPRLPRPPRPRPVSEPAEPEAMRFLVVDGPVKVRTEPSLNPAVVKAGVALHTGQIVEVDPASRREVDSYVWWQHRDGWSAERSVNNPGEVFMQVTQAQPGNDGAVPSALDLLFETWPINLSAIRWIQYFGNTTFAFSSGKLWNYDKFSQGLHAGLDFAYPANTTIMSGLQPGLEGTCTLIGTAHYTPFQVNVQVNDYTLIYGHVKNPQVRVNDPVNAMTAIDVTGDSVGENDHLHLEIRKGSRIINPLHFFPPEQCTALIRRFNPAGKFQPFDKWQSPLDQPEIVLGGPVIGPLAG